MNEGFSEIQRRFCGTMNGRSGGTGLGLFLAYTNSTVINITFASFHAFILGTRRKVHLH